MDTRNYDQSISEDTRRQQGAYFTPKLFVDYAHNLTEELLGTEWKESFNVWDPAWGTGNLTRDYEFKNLFCSTLLQDELDLGSNYNPEATKFQFDFLNDPLEKLPETLRKKFENNEPFVFFLNPPYGGVGTFGGGKKPKDTSNSIKEEMKPYKFSSLGINLSTQFLFRITEIKKKYNLTNCKLHLFCSPNYLSNSSGINFRKYFFDHFNFEKGVLFNAGHFADCKASWGIHFAMFGNDISKNNNPENFITQEELSDDLKDKFKIFENDSIIYSLFHGKNQSSSLKNLEWNESLYSIKNELFWVPKEVVLELAKENDCDEIYDDCINGEERWVANYLKTKTFSKEAQDVLDAANELFRKSFKFRKEFNINNPKYQIMNFDSGWYQVRGICKEYLKDDLNKFKELYKKLHNKLEPQVYEFGYLLK